MSKETAQDIALILFSIAAGVGLGTKDLSFFLISISAVCFIFSWRFSK